MEMSPEQSAFLEQLYREQFKALKGHAFGFVKNWGDAECVVQESFRIACMKIDDVMTSPNPIGWMKDTVKNTAYNFNRIKKKHLDLYVSIEEMEEQLVGPEMSIEEPDQIARLKGAVSEKNFAFFRRIVLEGVSYLEIAKEEKISIWACYKRFERIKKKLQAAIQNARDDESQGAEIK